MDSINKIIELYLFSTFRPWEKHCDARTKTKANTETQTITKVKRDIWYDPDKYFVILQYSIYFWTQSALNKTVFHFVQEVCELPLLPGICDAALPRVYFDSSVGQCKDFIYGGCGGNANNFRNGEECEELCGGISYTMLHVLLKTNVYKM